MVNHNSYLLTYLNHNPHPPLLFQKFAIIITYYLKLIITLFFIFKMKWNMIFIVNSYPPFFLILFTINLVLI